MLLHRSEMVRCLDAHWLIVAFEHACAAFASTTTPHHSSSQRANKDCSVRFTVSSNARSADARACSRSLSSNNSSPRMAWKR